ncbi:hypothetical protein BSKO_03916 [Bryopsis sp. KO-2023]|nr:hypothetical protein BSKO_03916 [Bryopsis sp. KO-2023]
MIGLISWALPSPFVAQVIRRAALHDLKSFFHAKQVCRSWRDAGAGDDFNRKLLEECVDVTEVKETGCFFDDYEDDWYCYWDDSYGVPDDMETNYAFKPLPVGTKAGFMTIPNADILGGGSPLETLKVIKSLLSVGKELARVQASPGMGSEGDSDLTPIILPWDSGKNLTPDNVLSNGVFLETRKACFGADVFGLLD